MTYSDGAPESDDIADINSVHNSDSSDSSALDDFICKDINDLVDSCHTLHANVIIANNLLDSITDKINSNQTINVIYEGEKMDFYDLLELLHKNAINDIKEGRPNGFENQLLNQCSFSMSII
jgi:hypothetical protein